MSKKTPEGLVKEMVRKVLSSYGDELDSYWPVPFGMGALTLDCIVCYRGHHIEIETKAPGKKPTPRQEITIVKKKKAGAAVFVIDGDAGCRELDEYLQSIILALPFTGAMHRC